jgi:multiple sugar transport system substrate-binding protein
MMKRTTKLIALVMPLASLGLTGARADTGDSDTLTLLSYWAGEEESPTTVAFFEAVEGFEEEFGVEVDMLASPTPEELHTRYEQLSIAGDAPDVVMSNLFGKPTSWLENGATVDVSGYVEEWGLAEIIEPLALEQWTTAEGALQGFPFEGFYWPVWYNMTLLEQAGWDHIPQTTDELIELSAALREQGIQPITTGGRDWSGNKLFSLVIETMLTDDQAVAAYESGEWDTPEIRAAVETFVELRDAGVFWDNAEGFVVEDQYSAFDTGVAAIMHAGSWAFGDVDESQAEQYQLGGFPLPEGAVREHPVIYTAYTATGFWISPDGEADSIDLVRELITYFYRPDVLGTFAEAGRPVSATWENIEVDESTLAPLFVAAQPLPDSTTIVELSDVHVPSVAQTGFERATSLAFTPDASVDDIIAALQQAWES